MKNRQLYQPFELHVSDMAHWDERPLVYQFFEIVQIIEGEGTRVINEHKFPYKKGGLFLFTPLDCRGFESSTPTRFCSIRFSAVFLEQYKSKEEKIKVIQRLKRLEHIFTHHNKVAQLTISNEGDCRMIASLIENMIVEYQEKLSYYDENLQHLVTLVLNVMARNVSHKAVAITDTRSEEPLINKILVYLHQNIGNPEQLRIKHLAAQFNLSANYIGEYFKNLTGDTIHAYITRYKINFVVQRLMHSEHSIGEIAFELGFSDESHLSKQFKQYQGLTPAAFRKRNKQ